MSCSTLGKYTRSGNEDHNGKACPIADDVVFGYGTAGFRANASVFPFIMYRMGVLAALRSRHLKKAIGLMITASHNPENDNGVKLIDPSGEMLEAAWEKFATDFVNCKDAAFESMYRDLAKRFGISLEEDVKTDVLCGIDTRPSSVYLGEAARHGSNLIAPNKFRCFGLVTTPQLHYIVRCVNDPTYGLPTVDGYYTKYSVAFNEMLALTEVGKKYSKQLVVDCANGVGALKLEMLMSKLKQDYIKPEFRNVNGTLNFQCGADFVKIEQKLPAEFEEIPKNIRCASLDGDADRLLYFYRDSADKFVLLDGDKIATLFAKFFQEQLKGAGLSDTLSIAIVQTAYANGSSSRYIAEKLGMKIGVVPTGVKHLHHEAIKYDIGIYFEANGHGTVVFSDKFREIVDREEANEKVEMKRLRQFSKLINEVVGDAMSDLLGVEILLMYYGWSVEDWAKNLYQDAPNCQLKVTVRDRTIFKTTPDESRLVEPAALQATIDEAVAKCQPSRCFVRPSGTEAMVRVYAEGPTPDQARSLAETVKAAVIKACE